MDISGAISGLETGVYHVWLYLIIMVAAVERCGQTRLDCSTHRLYSWLVTSSAGLSLVVCAKGA